jgi:alpha-beta hydrolase superfamily lysophospholipase
MKLYLITIFLLLTRLAAYPQTNPAADPFAVRFIKFYNSGQLDSLHAMFAVELTKQFPLDKQDQLIQTFKIIGGKMIKGWKIYEKDGFTGYLFSFEKPAYLLNIALDKKGKIQGVFSIPNDKKQPGDITVKTATSVIKGTLSVPEGSTNIPVVLVIAGSGPTDRDGNSTLSSKIPNSYLLLSDSLKQKGIAVLRFDKRGIGQSTMTKSQEETVFEDMVMDAVALIKFLKTDKRFSKIIIAGHSEGSLIGMLALQQEKADGFISLAGPGFPINEVLKTQFKQGGISGDSYTNAAMALDSVKAGLPVNQKMALWLRQILDPSLQTYMHSWMKYDPQKEIGKLAVPVLIVQGTQDMHVSIADGQMLKKGKPAAQLKIIEGMGHGLKAGSAQFEADAPTAKKGNLPLRPALIPALTVFINSIK